MVVVVVVLLNNIEKRVVVEVSPNKVLGLETIMHETKLTKFLVKMLRSSLVFYLLLEPL